MLLIMGSMEQNLCKACLESCLPVFGDRKCPSCDLVIDSSQSYLEHVCSHHCPGLDIDDIVHAIEDCGPDLMSFAETLRSF